MSVRLSRALLATLPLAIALTSVGEVVSVLRQVPGIDASLFVGVTGEVARAMVVRAWPTALLILASAGVLATAEPRATHRRALAFVVVTLSLANGLFAHHLLTVDTHMGPFVTFWVLMLGLGGLCGLVLALPLLRELPRVRLASGVFLTVIGPIIWAIHYDWLPDVYLPAEAFVIVTLTCLAVGLPLCLRTAKAERAVLVTGSVVCLAVAICAIVPGSREARSAGYLGSAIVRARIAADAVAAERDALWPTVSRPRSLGPEPDGLALFQRHSGLPPLPDTLSLGEHDILLVVSEALRYPETSLADPSLETMPHLAAFAEGAFSFSEASSPSVATFPSMSSVLSMTTLSFAEIEILPHFPTGRLRSRAHTVQEVLRESGYATFWAGHNGGRAFTTYMLGLQSGFDETHLFVMRDPHPDDTDIADAAITEIRRHRDANERYFGMVFFQAPHDPYRVHEPDRPSSTARDRYRQELRFVDRQMARVLAEVSDDTIVIVMGDHGEAFREHRVKYHSSNVHREQAHIPMVVRVPGVAPSVIDANTSSSYVFAWLLLHGPPPARAAAERAIREELAPLFRETEGAVLVELIGHRHLQTALRYPDYTVLYDLLGDAYRIYDKRTDPDEHYDLAPLRADLTERFRPRLDAYRRARFAGQRFVFIDAL
jgi:arylsulfatase A-like enzyme